MKSAVIFYSHTGTTRALAEALVEHLAAAGAVTRIELQPTDESRNFFAQGRRAFKRIRAQLAPVEIDLSAYDCVCLGTPVWAFGPAPAMNAYLDRCRGLTGKEVVLFCTSGGTGAARTFKYMRNQLTAQSVRMFREIALTQTQMRNREKVRAHIVSILPLSPNG